MKKHLIIPLLLAGSLLNGTLLTAQSSSKTAKPSAAATLSQADFAETISSGDLKLHLMTIASDEYQGRETGKEGQKMAARYISEHFNKLSLEGPVKGGKNQYYQAVPLEEGGWDNPKIMVDDMVFTFLDDFYTSPEQEAIELSADDMVFLGYGIDDKKYSNYKGVDVKGKVVVLMRGEPQKKDETYLLSNTKERSDWSKNPDFKLNAAKKNGAKAVLTIDEEFDKSMGQWGHYLKQRSMKLQSEKGKEILPLVVISPEMAQKLFKAKKYKKAQKTIKQGKTKSLTANKNIDFQIKKDVELFNSENVLGFLEGTDLKEEVLVITSHYDHLGKEDGDRRIYNGADDDGSGTVAVLEIAEAFAKAKAAGSGPRRSILFMTVTAEEKGLLGSSHYSDNPIFPLKNTIANLNIDMVGRIDEAHDDGNYVYIIGSNMLSTELHDINLKMNDKYTKLYLDYTYNDKDDPNRFYYRSDHYNFAKHNIPIIFYFNGVHADYHQPTDTPDKIDYTALQNRARLAFHTAWQLANQDKRIEVNVAPQGE